MRSQREPLIAETIEGKPLRFWVITGSQRGSRLDGPSDGHGCVAGVLEVHEVPATDTFPNETAESRRFVFPDSIALTAETFAKGQHAEAKVKRRAAKEERRTARRVRRGYRRRARSRTTETSRSERKEVRASKVG